MAAPSERLNISILAHDQSGNQREAIWAFHDDEVPTNVGTQYLFIARKHIIHHSMCVHDIPLLCFSGNMTCTVMAHSYSPSAIFFFLVIREHELSLRIGLGEVKHIGQTLIIV